MIKLIKPYVSFPEVEDDFRKIFESGMLTKGEYVNQFTEELKVYLGCKHAFLTTSATAALSICLKILGIGKNDEVIISDFSFPATANVVEDIGAKPVFADVDRDMYNMQPQDLERKITGRTKAVIFVDALGNPSGLLKIKEICSKRNIPLIEDAACAIGSMEGGMKTGSIADLTCFSFHPRKLLTTGEGGAVTTNNRQLAHKLQVKLNHGAVVQDGKQDFIQFGYNYRLSELQAAMGSIQLKKLDMIIQRRNLMADEFEQRLSPLGFIRQKIAANVLHNVQSLVFIVPKGINRDHLIMYLKENGIEATLGTYCLSNTTYYRNKYNNVQPVANYLEQNTLTLPCHDEVDFSYICLTIQQYMNKTG